MTVMLAGVELPNVQKVSTDEGRAIVEHRVPGLEGSVLQDMGRGSTAISLEGVFHGEEALGNLEELRGHFKAGEPVLFTADITTATDVSEVLIDDLEVKEVAGRPNYYRYTIRLVEYVPPPTPAAPGLETPIDAEIGLEAEEWSAGLADNLDLVSDITDTLGSIPDFGNPTEPLMGALDDFKAATSGLDDVTSALKDLYGSEEA
jgi:hypothetical protein